MTGIINQVSTVTFGYAMVFGLAGVACLASIRRARRVDQPDIRRGLVWLLLTSGGWALFKLGFLLGPDAAGEVLYTVGLVVGFGTVWAWLYFCSAYTGRTYHRRPILRRLGLVIFATVVAAKLTNPIHGQYFTLTETATPFTHLAVNHGPIHWVATGLSYTLAAVGLFMLYELYLESGYDTRPLAALSGLLALPVVFDLVALWTPLIEIIYAPLGVAAFTIGVLFVFERRFLAVQVTGDDEGPAVFLDSEGRVQDYTPAAASAFPALQDGLGRPLQAVVPELAAVDDGQEIVETESGEGVRYYMTATSRLELGEVGGQMVALSDVTAAERRRRELARHNQQLEEFASALTHELRNVIQIIDSRMALAGAQMKKGSDTAVATESIDRAREMTDRMSGLVDDFRALARYGQTVEELSSVEFGPSVEDGWSHAETGEMRLTVEGTGRIKADPGRLRQLLVNAFEFARHNGASRVRVELLDDGFAVTDDGDPPSGDTGGYFAFGEAVPNAESGMKLPNVRAFARVHGWTVALDTDYSNGARLLVKEVTVTAENRDAVDATPEESTTDRSVTGVDTASVPVGDVPGADEAGIARETDDERADGLTEERDGGVENSSKGTGI